jgi:hypothetical protein
LRRFTLALAGLLAICASASGAPQAAVAGKATAAGQTVQSVSEIRSETRTLQARQSSRSAAISWLGSEVYGYQHATWHWQRLMGVSRTPTEGRVLSEMSIPDVEGAVKLWERRAAAARRAAQHPPHLSQFLCIHHYEGSWTDGGGPYYGGLQMDLGFQRTYAPQLLRAKGTADHWTPLEQIWAAEKAARSRGFWPWPNTARFCGLI